MMSFFSKLPDLKKSEIRLFRLAALIFLIFVGLTYFFPFSQDQGQFRKFTIVSDVLIIALFVSTYIKSAKKYLDYLFAIWFFIAVNALLFITYVTNADPISVLFMSLMPIMFLVLPFRYRMYVYAINAYTYIGLFLVIIFSTPDISQATPIIVFIIFYFIFTQYSLINKFKSLDQEDSLSAFPEKNPGSVTELDSKGKLIYYNPATIKFFPDIEELKEKHPIFTKLDSKINEFKKDPNNNFSRKIKIANKYFQQWISYSPAFETIRIYTSDITDIYKTTKSLEQTKKELENEQEKLMSLLDDLSEQKNYESVRNEILLDNISEGIILTDESGKVTYINDTFTEVFGFEKDDLLGKDLADVLIAFDLNDKKMDASMLSNSAAMTQENQQTKIKLQMKNGDLLPVDVRSAAVKVEGKFKGVVRIFHDITEDVKLAQQKDDFFSIASHELRTPLTVISGNIDIILQGYSDSKLSPDDEELLKDTLQASDRLIRMVNDFLNVSRLDQGRLNYSMEVLNPCEIVESVVKEVKVLADEKGVDLVYTCDEKHENVEADEGLLKEIIINLIGNSIKFTEKGSITVSNSVENNSVVIRVTDTGMGIEKEKQAGLFARFQQAMSKTLAREAGGTGLGLYISREFARKMGGDLVLEKSEYKKGSVFRLTLPAVDKKIKATKTKKKTDDKPKEKRKKKVTKNKKKNSKTDE